jgi:anti-anti-sigma regulatory factor
MSGTSGQIPSGRILARRLGDEVCFLVVGRACANHSPAVRHYAEKALASGVTMIQVDLSDCAHCDSTFLGTLFRLCQDCRSHGPRVLQLVRPSAAVRQILAHMGATRLFNITEKPSDAPTDMTWQQLDDHYDRMQAQRFKQNVVDAHEALAGAGGELAQKFGPLAEAMREELAAEQAQQT